MTFSFELILIVAILLLYLDIVFICRMIINKAKRAESDHAFVKQYKNLIGFLNGQMNNIQNKYLLKSYSEVIQSVELKGVKSFEDLDVSQQEEILKRNIKDLRSRNKIRRIRAAGALGVIKGEAATRTLEKALVNEKDYSVKLYMVNALSDIRDRSSLPILIESLVDSHRWYREKVNSLICDFGEDLHAYLPQIDKREEIEIKELIVYFSTIYISSYMKNYLVKFVDNRGPALERLRGLFKVKTESCSNCIHGKALLQDGNRLCEFKGEVEDHYLCSKYKRLPVSNQSILNYEKLLYRAAEILAELYDKDVSAESLMEDEDFALREIAITSLANSNELSHMIKLVDSLEDDRTARVAVNAISKIIENNPSYIKEIVRLFKKEVNYKKKNRLAEVLSSRVEYFILKLVSEEKGNSKEIIKEILMLGKTSEIIGFLNKNRDIEVENALVEIVRSAAEAKEELKTELEMYLNDRLLKKCRLLKQKGTARSKEEKKDKKLIRQLYTLLVGSILLFPAVYVIRYYEELLVKPWVDQLRTYVIDFNYYLAYYATAVNIVYLLLLGLSYINSSKQLKLWNLKSMSFLFKKKILPGISVIAPAFNEEKTIIESTNSLLNLKYPDYELIIVNDGSRDNTLNTLIQQFELSRVDYIFEYKINTMPIRGVYRNPSIPKLLVVDKENGGKADSLNAGINISNKEYFCGIDADSLLEEDALLKLASLTLDEGIETPALGGNIFPINGCRVESGVITDIKIPKNNVARLQTVEYIRAFMAGRLGWAYTNSLLIISGAFGLFRKERIIGIGGYLTSSGSYAKDTVGEDMELVVRISRLMRELGLKYRICYSFNANCWTEVPEDLNSLKKQRYRWHRGLIDILTFHKKVLFNPSYGRMGLMAMPYFFIFEMMGPLVEIQGYIMVALAFFLGLLNIKLAIMLFVSTVLMGTMISILSLLIAEKDLQYFSYKDIFTMILYAIIENFGPRQLFSFWRVGGYMNMLKKPQGWGKLERKGFAANKSEVAG